MKELVAGERIEGWIPATCMDDHRARKIQKMQMAINWIFTTNPVLIIFCYLIQLSQDESGVDEKRGWRCTTLPHLNPNHWRMAVTQEISKAAPRCSIRKAKAVLPLPGDQQTFTWPHCHWSCGRGLAMFSLAWQHYMIDVRIWPSSAAMIKLGIYD